MKFCFYSATLRNFELSEAFRLISTAGYDGVELTLIDPHMHMLKATNEQAREAQKQCADLGLEIACACVAWPTLLSEELFEPSIIAADPKGRQQRIDSIRRSIEIAHHLDCPVVNIVSSFPPGGVPTERAREWFLEGINTLLPELGDKVLVVEPEPDFFVETTTDAIEFIKEINSPGFRLMMDIGHVYISEKDCYGAIERALPYTRHIHIEDIKDMVHDHLRLGEGDIDFERIAAIMKAANYQHFISVELQNHLVEWQRALYESRDYLRKMFAMA